MASGPSAWVFTGRAARAFARRSRSRRSMAPAARGRDGWRTVPLGTAAMSAAHPAHRRVVHSSSPTSSSSTICNPVCRDEDHGSGRVAIARDVDAGVRVFGGADLHRVADRSASRSSWRSRRTEPRAPARPLVLARAPGGAGGVVVDERATRDRRRADPKPRARAGRVGPDRRRRRALRPLSAGAPGAGPAGFPTPARKGDGSWCAWSTSRSSVLAAAYSHAPKSPITVTEK